MKPSLPQCIADWFSDRYYNTKTRREAKRDYCGQVSITSALVVVILVLLVIFLVNRV